MTLTPRSHAPPALLLRPVGLCVLQTHTGGPYPRAFAPALPTPIVLCGGLKGIPGIYVES